VPTEYASASADGHWEQFQKKGEYEEMIKKMSEL